MKRIMSKPDYAITLFTGASMVLGMHAWQQGDHMVAIGFAIVVVIGIVIVKLDERKNHVSLFIRPTEKELTNYVGTTPVRWCGADDYGIHALHRWNDYITDPMTEKQYTITWVCLGHECDDPSMHV